MQQVSRRAFLIRGDLRQFGVNAGALHLHENRYYVAVQASFLAPEPATEWKKEPIFPMGVLQFPDSAAARKQSSVNDEGPRGVLVGAGSLGSAMLNLWTRAGWGKWSVHRQGSHQAAQPSQASCLCSARGRVEVRRLAELIGAATGGAAAVTPVRGDACDLRVSAHAGGMTRSTLVVDTSAALEYPRLASFHDGLPRHATVFVTPSGNGAVLMLEDQQRTTRLRTLEAQYYRALLRQDWGAKHLEGNLATYWSGASCRDISVAMPYSRITAHASTLAEQVMLHSKAEVACIRIWDRDAQTGVFRYGKCNQLPNADSTLVT